MVKKSGENLLKRAKKSRDVQKCSTNPVQGFASCTKNPFISPSSTSTTFTSTTASLMGSFAAQKSKAVEEEKELLDKIDSFSKKLSEAQKKGKEQEAIVNALKDSIMEYQKQENIKYLLGKLDKSAEKILKTDLMFLDKFTPGQPHDAFVISIDIRSSTELMLNAKNPEAFAKFITGLCSKLTDLVINNGGIFDKFTGDGVIAFFPEFYSGPDAGYRTLVTASKAITFFNEHYKKYRNCFSVIKANTGLGVGIDYGTVHFVNIGESLSVVGNPVVYACRLSSTGAGTICINQPAFEILKQKYHANIEIEERTLDIKGSGQIHVYQVNLKGDQIDPKALPWKKALTPSRK